MTMSSSLFSAVFFFVYCLYLISSPISAQFNPSYTILSTSSPSVTVSQNASGGALSWLYYQYSTGTISTLTDLSVVLIAQTGQPTAYISSTSFTAAPTTATYIITQSGSVLLNSPTSLSGNAQSLFSSSGGTVYVAISLARFTGPSTYTVAFSSTSRLSLANGNLNQSVSIPAMKANSVQYITWQFTLDTANYLRGYYSFAAGYTTNIPTSSLNTAQSVAIPQPAIVWAHNNWADCNCLGPDPLLPSTMLVKSNGNNQLQYATPAGSSIITFDRDQSYPYNFVTIATYVFAVYIPYDVTSTSQFTLSNMFTTATAGNASDYGGDDFLTTPITTAGISSVSIATGQVIGYSLTLPSTTGTNIQINLTSISGNADLFVVRTAILEGATLNALGQANDAGGIGWGQGNNLASNGWWVGSGGATVPTYDFVSQLDGDVDSVDFTYVQSTGNAFYTILVFGQRAAVFSLSVNVLTGNQIPIQVVSASSGSVTGQGGGTVAFYSYTYTGTVDSNTDISIILISSSGTPITYVSTATNYPSSTSYSKTWTGTGSALSHSSTLSGNAQTLVTTSGQTIYVAVAAGPLTSTYSLAFSATERISMSGFGSQSYTLAATPANTMQYVSWTFPVQHSNRDYYSFAFTYTSNTNLNGMGLGAANAASQSLNQPAITYAHTNFRDTSSAPPDPTLAPTLLTQASASTVLPYANGAFITFDRDQSYGYTDSTTSTGYVKSWYVFAVYLPVAVPAGAVITLSDVNSIATVNAANDYGGDDFQTTMLSLPSAAPYQTSVYSYVPTGSLNVYQFQTPPQFSGGILTITLASNSSNVANADLFVVPTVSFYGAFAPVGYQTGLETGYAAFNVTSGTADDFTSYGWAQGANYGTNGYWVDTTTSTPAVQISSYPYYDVRRINSIDIVQFAWTSSMANWYTVLVFGQSASSYNLTILFRNPTTLPITPFPNGGLSGTTAAGAITYYNYTVPSYVNSNTDLSFVLTSSGVPANGVAMYISMMPLLYPGPNGYTWAVTGNGQAQILAGKNSTSLVANVRPGSVLNIGIFAPATSVSYAVTVSLTSRLYIWDIQNITVNLPSMSPGTIQYISWNFPLEQLALGTGARGYYSFAAGYTANAPLATLQTNVNPAAPPAPVFYWAHNNFQGNNLPPNDPLLPQNLAGLTPANGLYQTAAFVAFDRDQSYPGGATQAWYQFAIYTPYVVPSGVFSLSSMDPGASAATATDAGGDDFLLSTIQLGSTYSGSVGAGGVVGYRLQLPASTSPQYASVVLTTLSGNADLFIEPLQQFYGVVTNDGWGRTFNPNTGLINDNGAGWGQGAVNMAGSTFWTCCNFILEYNVSYQSTLDVLSPLTEPLYLSYTSSTPMWYTVLIFGERTSTYTISTSITGVTYSDISIPGYQSQASVPAQTLNFYQFTYTGRFDSNTDLSVFLTNTVGNSVAYVALSGTPSPVNTANVVTLNTANPSALLHSAYISTSPVNILSSAGVTVYIGVLSDNVTSSYTIGFSATQRIYFTGYANAAVSLPATQANTLQYFAWNFTMPNPAYERSYNSFSVGYSSNSAASALGITGIYPSLTWSHYEWINNNSPSADPYLVAPMSLSASQATPTGVFVTYDRDQSYPTPTESVGWYVWLLFVPYAVPAGGVLSLSNMPTSVQVAAATDSGGDDFPRTPVYLNTPITSVSISTSQVLAYALTLPPTNPLNTPVTVSLTSSSGQSYLYALTTQAFFGAIYALDPVYGTINEQGTGWEQDAIFSPNGYWGLGISAPAAVPTFPYQSTADQSVNSFVIPYTPLGNSNSFYTIIVFGVKAGTFTLSITGPTTPILAPSSSAGGAAVLASSAPQAAAASSAPQAAAASSAPQAAAASSAPASATSTPSNPPAATSSSSSSLGSGAIAGIVIGGVAALVILCLLLFCCCFVAGSRTKKAPSSTMNADEHVQPAAGSYSTQTDTEPSAITHDNTAEEIEMQPAAEEQTETAI